MNENRVALIRIGDSLDTAMRAAIEQSSILAALKSQARVALKPNFTYPYYNPGVTTSPAVIRALVVILRDYTPNITVVETDGGYGAWPAREAFEGHGMYELQKEFGIRVVNLCDEPSEMISFRSGAAERQLPLPKRLLHETDLFITMPVPKIHSMTGLTLAYKNQWGCVPDTMRLRQHHVFDDAIVAINQILKPKVVADGTVFLDENGPMAGTPVRMGLIIAASNAGAFDRYTSELMGYPWKKVRHLRRAVALSDMPERLDDICFNIAPSQARMHTFQLKRTLRNYIALAGFKSRFITWLGYESWFGRVVLHSILYAIAGKNVKPKPNTTSRSSGR